jgi:eukaryotic-like serine/threonine-protein kinase
MSLSTDEFLKCVLRSGLMDRSQLQDTLREVPSAQRADPRTLAEHLIRIGKLSSFQAYKLLRGATLGLRLGHYHILTPIGKGGMGTVYLALDTRSGLHVAVKVLPPKLASKKSHYLARFQREMEISQRVSHPNVAKTYNAGEDQGVYYIAMEYIPGMSLARLVNKSGPLTVERAARLFTEIAAGLEHAHGLNIIHRDLKPSNIMITPNDHAKVLDLGLAILEGEKQQPIEVIGGKGYLVGSLDYMAPEQTENSQAVDARADLYALGCSLYFAVTGKAPFAGGDKRDKVHAQRHLEAFPAHHRNPEVPDRFSILLEKLMAKNPDRRVPTARAVRDELRVWCPAESASPMDERDDPNFRRAVEALEKAPLAGDPLGDAPILPTDGAADAQTRKGRWPLVQRSIDVVVGCWVLVSRTVRRWLFKER